MSEARSRPAGQVRVVRTDGGAPTLWRGRSAVYFANVLSLFFDNDEGTRALEQAISGVDSYGGRLLPLIGLLFEGGDNMLILEHAPDAALARYFERDLGLSLPEVRVLPHGDYLRLGSGSDLLSELQQHPAGWMHGFVTDDHLVELAEIAGKRTLCVRGSSARGNNKVLFHEAMEAAGHPVFETRMAADAAGVADGLRELEAAGYARAGVKSAVGASGIGLLICPTCGAPPEVPPFFFHEGPCMVQGWLEEGRAGIEGLASPSVQMFLDDDTVTLFDLTEQILSEESVHQGNESPPPYLGGHPGLEDELFRQAADAGGWLHGQGYRGTASIDFLVAFSGSGFVAYGCEINARVTGATYPSVLARHHLPGGAWLMRNLRMANPVPGGEILQLLERHGHLFRRGARRGILPINFNLDGADLVTKGQFLCLGADSADCHQLLRAADEDLPLRWGFDRD